jgi:hypothetical protein
LEIKELRFWQVQKSAQESENKGDSELGIVRRGTAGQAGDEWIVVATEMERDLLRGGVPNWEELVYTPAVFVRVASKGLRGYGK